MPPEPISGVPTDDDKRKPPRPKPQEPYNPTLPRIRKSDTARMGGERYVDPDEDLIDQFEAYFYDGMIDRQGRILNAVDRNTLVYGRAKDASPEYWAYLDRLNKWATEYPTSDPRVWVPLAKKGIRAGTLIANEAVAAGDQNLANLDGYGKTAGSSTGGKGTGEGPARKPDEPTDSQGGLMGLLGSIGDKVSQFFGDGSAYADVTNEWEKPAEAVGGFANDVQEGIGGAVSKVWDVTGGDSAWDKSGLDSATDNATGYFKGAVRNTFDAMWMPKQALDSVTANLDDDLKDGDWTQAGLHLLGIMPIAEAAMIGLENATGTQFYRDGGDEQTNWSQTNMGQTILDLTGQGGEEQFGGADDKPGLQTEQGTGFFAGAETSKWQERARLNANTLVQREDIDGKYMAQYKKIARMQGPEEALAWAAEQGFQWDEVEETLYRPAQGFTIGRASAIAVGASPYTEAYKTMSGVIDFANAIFGDPITYIPGGAIKSLVKASRGGGKIAGGADDAATIFREAETVVAGYDDVADLLAQGLRTSDIGRQAGGKVRVVQNFSEAGGRTAREVDPQYLDEMIDEMVSSGQASTRASAVDGLAADGWTWDVRRGVFEEGLSPEEYRAMLAEGTDIADMLRDVGGFEASRKAMNWFSTPQGWAIANGLARETNSFDILTKSGGKFSPETATLLAKASTPNEVIEALAPRIGGRVKYQNDLARFVDKQFMPTYSTKYRFWNATDLDRYKKAWVNHIPGMSFMPGRTANTDNVEDLVEQWTRFGNVSDTGLMNDQGVREAMSRLVDTSTLSGPAARATRYQAQYGQAGRTVLLDADGQILRDHHELKIAKEAGATEDEILRNSPPGSYFEDGQDGVLQAMLNALVKNGTIKDEALARHIGHVWGKDDAFFRKYAQDGQGGDWIAPWSKNGHNEPTLEAHVLGQTSLLPDIEEMRKHTSRWGHLADKYADEGGVAGGSAKAAQALNDITTKSVYYWKHQILMVGGLRLPIYTFRAAADTQMAITLQGGASIFHHPADWLGLVLTSAVRKAQTGEHPRKLARDRAARSLADNSLVRLMWRGDELTGDAAGREFADIMEKLAIGETIDHDSAFRLIRSMNMGVAGERGSMGQDVWYGGVGRDAKVAVRDMDGDWTVYSNQLADELWQLAKSPTAVRLASHPNVLREVTRPLAKGEVRERSAEFDSILQWFGSSQTAGASVYRQMSPEARAFALTREGQEAIIKMIGDQILFVTAGDMDLVRTIGRAGKHPVESLDGSGNPITELKSMYAATPGGGRELTDRFRDILKGKNSAHALDPTGPRFPEKLHTYVAQKGFKSAYDNYMRSLFHIAGKWEDIYAREPFYRERYYAHLEDISDLLLPTERAKLVADLRAKGSPKVAKRIEDRGGNGHFTRAELDDVASWRTMQDITDVAYDAANRREWAYALRLISPFVQAAVNGMYRWSKAALQNPESTYRVVRGIKFLSDEDSAFVNDWLATSAPNGEPLIFEDPNGQRRIGLPFSGILSSLLNMPEDTTGSFSMSASSLNFAFPGYERAQYAQDQGYSGGLNTIGKALFPGVGPVVSLPLSALTDGTSEWARDYLMPYGAPGPGWQNQLKLLVPGSLAKLSSALFPTPEEERRRGARVIQFYAMIVRQEGGLTNMTPAQMKSALERAKTLSNNFTVVEALASFASPASLSGDVLYGDAGNVPDHFIYAQQVADIYQRYLESRDYNYDEAEATFVADMGLDMLLLTGPSGFDTDAAPPTRGAMALRQTYREGYEKYGPILASILTSKDGSEFDLGLYSIQMGYGERIQLPVEMRTDLANQRILDYIYHRQAMRIATADVSDMEQQWAMNSTKDQLQALGWKGSDRGRSMQERGIAADLMMQAARDPEMTPFMGKPTQNHLVEYLTARQRAIGALRAKGLSGDLAGTGVSGAAELNYLFTLGETMAANDANFFVIWNKALRSEVLYEEEEG